MPGCGHNHGLRLWFPVCLQSSGPGLRLSDGPGVQINPLVGA